METGAPQSDLIQRLLLEAGRVMEDSASALALPLPNDPAKLSRQIDQLARSASALAALAAAASALQLQLLGQ